MGALRLTDINATITIETPDDGDGVYSPITVTGSYDLGQFHANPTIKCVLVHTNGQTYERGPFPPTPDEMTWETTFYDIPPTASLSPKTGAILSAHLLDEYGNMNIAEPDVIRIRVLEPEDEIAVKRNKKS